MYLLNKNYLPHRVTQSWVSQIQDLLNPLSLKNQNVRTEMEIRRIQLSQSCSMGKKRDSFYKQKGARGEAEKEDVGEGKQTESTTEERAVGGNAWEIDNCKVWDN